MIKYLLLFKRLLKKKSYILMLLVVPLMIILLNLISARESGLMTIGVCIQGDGTASQALKQDLMDNPGSFRYVMYDNPDTMSYDVRFMKLDEGWVIPDTLDWDILNMKSIILIREEGVSHLIAKEVLLSRIYPFFCILRTMFL